MSFKIGFFLFLADWYLGQVKKKSPVSHQTFFKMQMRRAVFLKFFILNNQFSSLTTELKLFTVDAIEVLIKYCTNSFPQVDQFI
jgi:hypothetical protein